MPQAVAALSVAAFADRHAGHPVIVCGCGQSLNALHRPDRFVTIGVNDVGRKFDPDYLVVIDPPGQFKGDRFDHVANSRARHLFTHRDDLGLSHPGLTRFRMDDAAAAGDPATLPHSCLNAVTPYIAACLALHMGASDIGVIGVDFTDNHFFAPTGPHQWASHLALADLHFERLGRAALARGSRLFNLSPTSLVTAMPRMDLESFAALDPHPARAGRSRPAALRIVAHAVSPDAGASDLARCVNAQTRHRAVGVEGAPPSGRGMAELVAADVVLAINGDLPPMQARLAAGKPVLRLDGGNGAGLTAWLGPALVPWPIAPASLRPRLGPVVVGVTASGATEDLDALMPGLRRACSEHGVALRAGIGPGDAHILVAGGHALEALAAGCVVVRPAQAEAAMAVALRHAAPDAPDPFIYADPDTVEMILGLLLGLGGDALLAHGAANRAWMARHWDFRHQWTAWWQDAVDAAQQASVAQPHDQAPRHRTAAMADPAVSVVIASLDDGPALRSSVAALAAGLPDGEIIVVDCGSTDGSLDLLDAALPVAYLRPARGPAPLGVTAARRLGAALATGRILVFADAQVAAPGGWAQRLGAALADPGVGAVAPAIYAMRLPGDGAAVPEPGGAPLGYGMRWLGAALDTAWLGRKAEKPYAVPLLGGAFLAMRREVYAAVGGFDPGMLPGDAEDAELSIRLWTLGYRCLVAPDVAVAQRFAGRRARVRDWETVIHNRLRLAWLHFGPARLARVLHAYRDHSALPAALVRLEGGDAERLRDHYRTLRRHDDDAFFAQFGDDFPAG